LQIVRVVRNSTNSTVKSKGKSWGYFFYPIVFLGTTCRAVFLLLWAQHYKVAEVVYILNTLPSYTFFSGYLVVLFCWARIYHNSFETDMPLRISQLRNVLLFLNTAMYSIYIALISIDIVVYPRDDASDNRTDNPARIGEASVDAFLYAAASIGFLTYSILLRSKMRRLSVYPATQIANKIHLITCIVVVTFTVRSVLVVADIVKNISGIEYVQSLYYGILELFPLGLMVYILKMDSGKGTSRNTEATGLLNKTMDNRYTVRA